MKPTLFIGSSTKSLQYARALQMQLASCADATVWDQGVFALNTNTLDALIARLNESDFAVFIFAPDDIAHINGNVLTAVRDNVLFEFGLFLGGLGKTRAFFILPNGHEFRTPTDLLGTSTVLYDAEQSNHLSALAPATYSICEVVTKLGIRQERLLSASSIETISNPRILCACSAQYFDLEFERDVALIKDETKRMAPRIVELYKTDSTELMKTLMNQVFDIVHISAFADARTGDIYFSDVDPNGVPREDVKPDSMAASGFARLIELCKARLVVLATCDSLLLAAKLARITTMIAATDWVSVHDMLQWELSFYTCLSKGVSVSNAFDTASSTSKAPMILLAKRDLAFVG